LEDVSTDVFATKFEINVLLVTGYDSEPDVDEKDTESHQKGKKLTLYDKDKTPLSQYLNSDEYIQVRAYKVSRFDFNQLESNMFANGDLLNAFIVSSANGIPNVRFHFLI
jgi:hypothetical protein